MSTSTFWDNVLEPDETLVWTGKPTPRLHWRNWRLYGSAPMAAIGMLAAAAFILLTYGAEGDIWLLILPAVLVLIPFFATWKQLRTYGATRYALTDKRALFFIVERDKTRVKAHPYSAFVKPVSRATMPPCVNFLRYETEADKGKATKHSFGFDYIAQSDALLDHLGEALK